MLFNFIEIWGFLVENTFVVVNEQLLKIYLHEFFEALNLLAWKIDLTLVLSGLK